MLVGVGKLSVFNFKWQVYPKVGFLPINLFRFFIVIVDIFSPFPILNESNDPVHEKRCGFLITCLITQSGQIELTFSLSADSFIYSNCRFVSRRGYTRGNKSDRGRCFLVLLKIQMNSSQSQTPLILPSSIQSQKTLSIQSSARKR